MSRRRDALEKAAPELLGAIASAALSVFVAVLALGLWRWHPTVPLSYSADALYYQEIVKSTLDHGWYLRNPDVGAPFGLASYDFPIVSNDSLQLIIVKAMGLFTKQPFLVANAFYVLTYALNAMGAYAALRWRRIGRGLAVLGGALYGILPLHFMKGVDHLFFSSYYMVPLGGALVLTVLTGEEVFNRRHDVEGPRRWLTLRNVFVLLLCAAIASAAIYYAIFTMLLLVSASLARGAADRDLRSLVSGLLATGAVGAFTMVNQIPTLLYRMEHGPNLLAASRSPAEGEIYGLRLIQLVLPIPGHRFQPFADLTDRYRNTTAILGEPSTAVGLVASVGLIWLLLITLRSIVSTRPSDEMAQERAAGFSLLICILWASTGALSTFFNYIVTPQFRAWSRMSVYIGFFGVLGFVHLLTSIQRRIPSTLDRRMLAIPAVVLFVFAALDQTSPRYAPDRAAIEAAYHADADFVHSMEREMPRGAAILELPYAPYPENPPMHRLQDYDLFRPYLHSKTLRWSYGAMKGRPEDWHAALSDGPLNNLLVGATASGFRGLLVDRNGYTDNAASLERDLTAVLGPPLLAQGSGRLVFWDLSPIATRVGGGAEQIERQAEVALRPVRFEQGNGFYGPESELGRRFRWMLDRADITIDNPDDEPRPIVFSARLRTGVGAPSSSTVRFFDGTSMVVTTTGDGEDVRRELLVPPGRSTITIENGGGPVAGGASDARRLVAQLVDASMVPVELCSTAEAFGAPAGDTGCLSGSRSHLP